MLLVVGSVDQIHPLTIDTLVTGMPSAPINFSPLRPLVRLAPLVYLVPLSPRSTVQTMSTVSTV